MSETEKMSISRGEYNALNFIEGLQEDAFHLVMSAKQVKHGRFSFILEGSTEDFDSLASDVFDEIYYRLSTPLRLKQLEKLYLRLSPDQEEF